MTVAIITTLDLYTYRVATIVDGKAISMRQHPASEITKTRNQEFERWSAIADEVSATPIPAIFNVHPRVRPRA